jgi:hypothetical protein
VWDLFLLAKGPDDVVATYVFIGPWWTCQSVWHSVSKENIILFGTPMIRLIVWRKAGGPFSIFPRLPTAHLERKTVMVIRA